LIQVLNCWALNSFSKCARQNSQKDSIAGMMLVRWEIYGNARKRRDAYSSLFQPTYPQTRGKI
jgi:hypothetical protein